MVTFTINIPLYVSIYTSTMDPMGFTALQALRIFETDRHQNAGFIRDINAMLQSMTTA